MAWGSRGQGPVLGEKSPFIGRDLPTNLLHEIRIRRHAFRLACIPIYLAIVFAMRVFGGYRIDNLGEVRRSFRQLSRRQTPLLICANHLTFIDSALILWALGPVWLYAVRPRLFAWNMPAQDVFAGRLGFRVIAFLAKCMFVNRKGPSRHRAQIVDVCCHLLRRGEIVTIFPEGGRSRTGRFQRSKLVGGAGQIVSRLGDCDVLCIHLRSDTQTSFSDYPKRGSVFRLSTELLAFRGICAGRRASRDVVDRIGACISALEERYFATVQAGAQA